jgi:glutamine amidotransferase
MVAIINYGLGNLTSILNMHRRLGIDAEITDEFKKIEKADRLILPGVGHFKRGMENLNASGLKDLLDRLVIQQRKPILGICLGAQLLTKHSEEGDVDGLGWIDAKTIKFDQNMLGSLKIPHMGWSDINIKKSNLLFNDLPENPRFYHVHSYHFSFSDENEISATSNYGYEFACAFNKENIYGTQFHPEKSHKYGMKIIENFSKISQ